MAVAGYLTYDTKIDRSGFEKGLSSLKNTTKTVGGQIKSIVTALGIDKLISTTFNILNSSLDGAISRLDTLNNYPKVMSNLGVASEDAEKSINKMSDKLSGLPTTLDEGAMAVQRFTSKNSDVAKSTDYFLALNNALLAGGASMDIQSTALEQLSQAYAKGKPDMMEWRSIQTAMPAQLNQVAKAFNMTSDELGEALRKGNISMDAFMDKIVELNEKGTEEFQSFEKQAKNSTGGIQTSITVAKTQVVKGVAEIIKSIDKLLKDKGLGGISNIISEIGKKAKDVLSYVAKNLPKIVTIGTNIVNVLKKMLPLILSATSAFVTYKTTMAVISAIDFAKKTLGTVSAFLKLIPAIRSAKDAMLLLNMAMDTNAVGILLSGIAALTTAFIYFKSQQKSVKDSFEEIGKGATDFYNELQTAEGYLNEFNETIFASNEEQKDLENQMHEIQNGITDICKTASDERRDYTQQEIEQLNEYFNKLRELKDREIEIYQKRIETITQLATTELTTLDGSIEEYDERGKQWLATAQQQADELIKIAENRRIEEIAALNSMYDEKDRLTNQDYLNAVENAEKTYQNAVDAANKQVGDVSSIYSNGYTERVKQEGGFYQTLQDYNKKQEEENTRHTQELERIQNAWYLDESKKESARISASIEHKEKMKTIWEEMYKNMNESQKKELGEWIAKLANTEMYGGKIDDETKEMVNNVMNSFDSMPKGTREAMKNAMQPMLEEMEKKEPSLYAKATGIASGIISRLKKAFEERSPSRATRRIFKFAMQGAELGLEDEEDKLNNQATSIAKNFIDKISDIDIRDKINSLNDSIITKMQSAVALETGRINATASLKANLANRENAKTINNDNSSKINVTQQFFNKNATPYEEQKQAKQQMRRLAYEL